MYNKTKLRVTIGDEFHTFCGIIYITIDLFTNNIVIENASHSHTIPKNK